MYWIIRESWSWARSSYHQSCQRSTVASQGDWSSNGHKKHSRGCSPRSVVHSKTTLPRTACACHLKCSSHQKGPRCCRENRLRSFRISPKAFTGAALASSCNWVCAEFWAPASELGLSECSQKGQSLENTQSSGVGMLLGLLRSCWCKLLGWVEFRKGERSKLLSCIFLFYYYKASLSLFFKYSW